MEKGRFNSYMKALKDEYNGTVVLEDLGCFGKNGERRVKVKCKYCNSDFITRLSSIKNKSTSSCGCFQKKQVVKSLKKHGDTVNGKTHPIYRAYAHIKDRCYNKNNKSYAQYGGIGVVMCEKWLEDYQSFKKWSIENGWKKGLQIDKDIKNKDLKIYSPETCMWITPEENKKHKRLVPIGKTGYRYIVCDKRKLEKGNKSYHVSNRSKYKLKGLFHTAEEAHNALQKMILEEE